jgi:hypothetical protein
MAKRVVTHLSGVAVAYLREDNVPARQVQVDFLRLDRVVVTAPIGSRSETSWPHYLLKDQRRHALATLAQQALSVLEPDKAAVGITRDRSGPRS